MSGDHNMYQKTKSYLDDFECPRCGHCCQALETEREWVGLTADEIWKCNKAKSGAVEFHICSAHQNVEDFAESIEAKLKEKNKW
jgi:Fe-S-cluster containining protein